jgi:hypothetical protein
MPSKPEEIQMKRLALCCLLSISATAWAANPLTADQIKTLIAGNSAAGFAEALGKNYTAYYSPDGKLIQLLEGKPKRTGTWKITDKNEFCTQFPSEPERCTKVTAGENGEYQRVKDDGMVTNTWKKFYKGNAYKY